MSVWADIRKRGIGAEIKKEDKVEEENSWNTKWSFSESIDQLKKEQIKLSISLSDFRRELDQFKWNKNKNYIKCNYKI